MSDWNIYSKDGVRKRATVKSLEYSGEWMGECFLSVTVKSPFPLDFQIGDYIDYRGERFTINYDPTVKKQARRDEYGEAFVYENVKFNADSDELTRADFCDYILSGSNIHYTSLPTFGFFAESVKDLCDRLLANLNRYCTGEKQWTIKILTSKLDDTGQNIWYTCGSNQAFTHADFGGERNVYVAVDNIMCWDAASYIKEKFKLNFYFRGRTLYVGTMGRITPIFRYGKGNGLTEIERATDSQQQIITRIKAYGSQRNIPIRYYANIFAKIYSEVDTANYDGKVINGVLSLKYRELYFTSPHKKLESNETIGYLVKMKAGDTEVNAIVFADKETVKTRFNVFVDDSRPLTNELGTVIGSVSTVPDALKNTLEDVENFRKSAIIGSRVYLTEGVEKGNFDSKNKEYTSEDGSALPDNMAVTRLMLPGFPHQSLKDWAEENPDWFEKWGIDARNYTFSDDPLEPWIQHKNAEEIGVLPGTVVFDKDDEDNGIAEIYPSIEEMTAADAGIGSASERLDEVADAEKITDNGIFGENETVYDFAITLPDLGFDLDKFLESDTAIHMRDGMCGEREFPVVSIVKNKDAGTFKCMCHRAEDSTLKRYFPYDATNGNAVSGKQPFQIYKGDHYVLLNIKLPDLYVEAASRKLLRYAIAYLDANCYTRYTYSPKVDNIFMARQNDAAKADVTGVTDSLHDTITEGDMMAFEDTDLGIEGNVVIDKLTIKEGSYPVPQYEVTLRDDKTVGTLQRMQNQIQSISSQLGGGSSVGGFYSDQIKDLIRNYGGNYFLSKLQADKAQGVIDFMKSLEIAGVPIEDIFINKTHADETNYLLSLLGGALLRYGMKSESFQSGLQDGFGFALVERDGRWMLEIDDLWVRGRMYVHELEVKKKTYTAGNLSLGNAGNTIFRVVPITASGKNVNAAVFAVPVKDGSNNITSYKIVAATKGKDEDGNITYGLLADGSGSVKKLLGGENIIGYKCYFVIDDRKKRVTNDWRVGDMAHCRTFNIEEGIYKDVSNRDYWRMVVEAGTEELEDGKTYAYVVLGNAQQYAVISRQDGSVQVGQTTTKTPQYAYRYMGDYKASTQYRENDVVRYRVGGRIYEYRQMNYVDGVLTPQIPSWSKMVLMSVDIVWGYAADSDIPAVDDDIVQEGNPVDIRRQGLITLDVSEYNEANPVACKIDMYENIGANTLSQATQYAKTEANNPIHISPKNVRMVLDELSIRAGGKTASVNAYAGEFTLGTAAKAGFEYTYNGEVWVCLQDTNTFPAEGDYWHKKIAKGTDGINGTNGTSFETKGSVIEAWAGNIEDMFEYYEQYPTKVAYGDKVLFDVNDSEAGRVIAIYDPNYENPYGKPWRIEKAAVGDAYIVKSHDGDAQYEGCFFVGVEKKDLPEDVFYWWQNLGQITGTDAYNIHTNPTNIIITESLYKDDDGNIVDGTMVYDNPSVEVVAYRGDKEINIQQVTVTACGGCITNVNHFSVDENVVSFNVGAVPGSGDTGYIALQVVTADNHTETIVVNVLVNRTGTAELTMQQGLARLAVTGKYYNPETGEHEKVASLVQLTDDDATLGQIKDGLLAAGIKIDYSGRAQNESKIEMIADQQVFKTPNGKTFAVFEVDGDGNPKIKAGLIDVDSILADNVTVKGNIYTPYFRVTQANFADMTVFDGTRYYINVPKTGVNLQIEFFDTTGQATWGDSLQLPPITEDLVGVEMNILNISVDANGKRAKIDMVTSDYTYIYMYRSGDGMKRCTLIKLPYFTEVKIKAIKIGRGMFNGDSNGYAWIVINHMLSPYPSISSSL